MAKITFTSEYRIGIATADGPSERVFAEGETIEVAPEQASLYIGTGVAVMADEVADRPLDKLKKDELVAVAVERGVEIDGDMTKAQILEAIAAAE